MVLDGLPGLYGLKYDCTTACGLPLYLCSYKLVGSATFVVNLVNNKVVYNLLILLVSNSLGNRLNGLRVIAVRN